MLDQSTATDQDSYTVTAAFEFQPRSAAEHLEVKGVAGLMEAAVKQKFLTKPLTDAEVKELVQVPPM